MTNARIIKCTYCGVMSISECRKVFKCQCGKTRILKRCNIIGTYIDSYLASLVLQKIKEKEAKIKDFVTYSWRK